MKMSKIFKVLGKRGRITIPFDIRQRMGFTYNDILSFEEQDGNTVVVKREKLCDGCRKQKTDAVGITLLEFIDGLTQNEQLAALVHLSTKWAKMQEDTLS